MIVLARRSNIVEYYEYIFHSTEHACWAAHHQIIQDVPDFSSPRFEGQRIACRPDRFDRTCQDSAYLWASVGCTEGPPDAVMILL